MRFKPFPGQNTKQLRWQTAEPLALTAALKWAKSPAYKADDTHKQVGHYDGVKTKSVFWYYLLKKKL